MTRPARFVPILLPAISLIGCQSGGAGGGFRPFAKKATEEWTIFCRELTSPHHGENCQAMAQSLRRTPGIRPQEVRCDHDYSSNTSRLYYGSYLREVNPETHRLDYPEQLRSDLQLIHSLGDDQNRRFFAAARIVPFARPEDLGRPEWALANADGVYSLQIAVFYPEPGFTESRRAAVELVAELRRQGHEAYYYHGDVQSMVTVGTFDESVVIQTEHGKQMLSPQVKALQASNPRFKYNYQNGRVLTKRIGGTKYPSSSFLVKIPRRQAIKPSE